MRSRPRGRVPGGVLAVALVGCLTTGCGGEAGSSQHRRAQADVPFLVLAASDLTAAFEEIEPAYEAATGEQMTVVFGSSGQLAAQIRSGAPADLYISANESFVDDLVSAGWIDADTRVEIGVGRLALIVPPGRPVPDHVEALSHLRYRMVAIANPEHAPYGVAARSALRAAGVWSELGDRLVMAENVAQALQYVRTGNADVGLVALGLVLPGDGAAIGAVPHRVVEAELHAPIRQVAGVVEGSPHALRAASFLSWITASEGVAILRRYGFEAPRP